MSSDCFTMTYQSPLKKGPPINILSSLYSSSIIDLIKVEITTIISFIHTVERKTAISSTSESHNKNTKKKTFYRPAFYFFHPNKYFQSINFRMVM